ncbi:hypothetical protein H4R19_002730, partial [Coemansia spiralis]
VIVSDSTVRGLLETLLNDERAQSALGASRIEDILMGEPAVSQRIDSSHFWTRFGIRPRYPYVLGAADPYPPGPSQR